MNIILFLDGLVNICTQSTQYQGKEYPCANIDMQDRLISLVKTGIPDGKSEVNLKNNGFGSGRIYKLIQKEQQQFLKVEINEKGPKKGTQSRRDILFSLNYFSRSETQSSLNKKRN
jgi:hypothetical protein